MTTETTPLKLKGFHHLTAVTADAPRNHGFYTDVMGLRLVKKSVNQDDTSSYHLFYADGKGSPGTDITFFDWPAAPERRGTHSIARTGFRVKGDKAFSFWADRFKEKGVTFTPPSDKLGRVTLEFEDFEGQRLSLVQDESATPFELWEKSTVPEEHQIHGLGPITLSVPELGRTELVLTHVMGMEKKREVGNVHVYGMDASGPVAEVHVIEDKKLNPHMLGAGGVHHVAFNIPLADYDAWAQRLRDLRVPNSGPVDRYWFKSLYFREPNGILFEIATDGPGFHADEPMESLGQTLSLPPFLEPRRGQIEAGLKKL
ncbi:MAG: ring-cleaving dioxygenase [Proteobacteria bacterium]|nr:ring-cleaving dioxygenase [Pseudomonadota bacterium]